MNFLNKNLIPIAIVIAGIVIAGAVVYINQQRVAEDPTVIPPQEIGERVINYINENILQGQATASLKEILEESGLYKMIITIGGQEFPAYVSRDGKLLFPEVINLDEEISPGVPTEVPSEAPSVEKTAAELESLAKCLTEKGMKLYGTYWCPWCTKQRELFREAAQYLPYIECAIEGTQQITPQCQAAGITGFPTWILPDGEKSPGFKPLEELVKLSGCSL